MVGHDVYDDLPLFRTLVRRFALLARLPFCPPARVRIPDPPTQEMEEY